MRLDFRTFDVFTTSRFGGNPLAVVLGADTLTTRQMQTIAREFNLSETIFVMAPADPGNTAKVRISSRPRRSPLLVIPPSAAQFFWLRRSTSRAVPSRRRSVSKSRRVLCPSR